MNADTEAVDGQARRKRRIEKSAEITVNLGNMQFAKIRNLIEEEVEYDTEESRDAYSRQMLRDLAKELKQDVIELLAEMGKTSDDEIRALFDACKTRMKRKTKEETKNDSAKEDK